MCKKGDIRRYARPILTILAKLSLRIKGHNELRQGLNGWKGGPLLQRSEVTPHLR